MQRQSNAALNRLQDQLSDLISLLCRTKDLSRNGQNTSPNLFFFWNYKLGKGPAPYLSELDFSNSPAWNIKFDELDFSPSLKTNWKFYPVQTDLFLQGSWLGKNVLLDLLNYLLPFKNLQRNIPPVFGLVVSMHATAMNKKDKKLWKSHLCSLWYFIFDCSEWIFWFC